MTLLRAMCNPLCGGTGRAVVAGIALLTLPILAQPSVPLGDDFQVNTYTTNFQFLPAVAASPSGEFVVTWMSLGSSGNDTSQYSIQLQSFLSDGSTSTGEVQANTYTTSTQQWPAVSTHLNGDIVVTWASRGSTGSDTAVESIQVRQFDASGSPLADEFQVNTSTTGIQTYPAVATADDGSFVVVWQSQISTGDDDQGYSIQGQLFSSVGAPFGGELQLNQHTPLDQAHPAVAMTSGGSFIVVWESASSPGDDVSLGSIQGRLFDSMGSPANDQFQVNEVTTGNQSQAQVAAADNGEFAVVWKGQDTATDEEGGIVARRFNAQGLPRGGEFQVNSYTTGEQLVPGIGLDGDGDMVITWESVSDDNGDAFRSIQGRRFSAQAETLGPQMLINSFTLDAQFLPVVASRGDGSFVVAWNSLQSPGNDDSSGSIIARLYGPDSDGDGITDADDLCFGENASGDMDGDGVCADRDCNDDDGGLGLPDECGVCGGAGSCRLWQDGFEKGDTSAWSSQFP